MYIKISLKNFQKIKKIASIVASSIINSSQNENVYFLCEENELKIYGNDEINFSYLTLKKSEDLKIIKTGEITINAKALLSLIDNLKNDEIEIFKTETNICSLISGSFNCNLNLIKPKENFIQKFNTEDCLKINLSLNTLKIIQKRFKDFCQQSTNSYQKNILLLNSINIKNEKEKKHLEICSTDSYRVVYGVFPYEGDYFDFNILPITLIAILNIFSNNLIDNIVCYLSDNKIIIENEEYSMMCVLVQGEYPKFTHWFNEKSESTFSINKNNLIEAIDRGSFLLSSNIRTTFITINKNLFCLEFKDSDQGTSKEEITIQNENDKKIEFSINIFFLKQLIKNIVSFEIIFKFIGSLKPIIFYGNEELFIKHFILPLKSY